MCSGADASLLKECGASERHKHAGIGATVFFTALMAFIAAGYALYTVFDNIWTAVAFGLVWGLYSTSVKDINPATDDDDGLSL